MADWIGYRWLLRHYEIEPVQDLFVDSAIGKARATVREGLYVHQYYPPVARPAASLAAHLAFALKHEGVHLELLARLFIRIPPQELTLWIESEPTGQYARRAGFFYEFLTGQALDVPDVRAGNYVPALDESLYCTAPRPINNARWRVRNNLPGDRHYCPLIRRTALVQQAEQYECAKHMAAMAEEYGTDLLQRSAVWLTIKESRASFAIEHEAGLSDRVQRFAAAMEQFCGRLAAPLAEASLTDIQTHILGARAVRYGLRRSPVFVGARDGFIEVVHYIAPHWQDVPDLLSGLQDFAARMQGAPTLVRAAVIAFGFVYIHPMSDGNGRLSRFLINDTLRRDGAVPAPFILPVSATIVRSAADRQAYDDVLEVFSRPLMRRYAAQWRFGAEQIGDDGVHFNLEFDAYQDALPAWRYPDLTAHVEYLFQVLRQTLEVQMHEEAAYLVSLRRARAGIKQVLEASDADIDRMIRSVRESNGEISNKLRKEFPALADLVLAEAVIAAISGAFAKA